MKVTIYDAVGIEFATISNIDRLTIDEGFLCLIREKSEFDEMVGNFNLTGLSFVVEAE